MHCGESMDVQPQRQTGNCVETTNRVPGQYIERGHSLYADSGEIRIPNPNLVGVEIYGRRGRGQSTDAGGDSTERVRSRYGLTLTAPSEAGETLDHFQNWETLATDL